MDGVKLPISTNELQLATKHIMYSSQWQHCNSPIFNDGLYKTKQKGNYLNSKMTHLPFLKRNDEYKKDCLLLQANNERPTVE